MENKKLTKELLDKVRHIEGFPKGKDEDIIELSDPPYFTACPNPFIQEFIDENGTPYDEENDDYHREPFASDVSEGKNDPIYNAHSYHTKVPHKAIMRYILHYTEPGDIVFDGFCGTGMTGVAAQLCEENDPELKMKLEEELGKVKWGARRAVLGDLSPAASFISYNLNKKTDLEKFRKEVEIVLRESEKECGWMYETQHVQNGKVQKDISGIPLMGKINYIVWSDVFICFNCNSEIVFWDVAVNEEEKKVYDEFSCPKCEAIVKKNDSERAWVMEYDENLGETIKRAKQAPVLIKYFYGKRLYQKRPDSFDFELIKKIERMNIPYWYPIDRMPEGDESRRNDRVGLTHAHLFYTKRNLMVISKIFSLIRQKENYQSETLLLFQSAIATLGSKLTRYNMGKRGNGPVSGTLYVASLIAEANMFLSLKNKFKNFVSAFNKKNVSNIKNTLIFCGSSKDLATMNKKSIDYIFTDPPFGSNLMYSELNFLWEVWLRVFTHNDSEAIINKAQKKGLNDYQFLMENCFSEMYRVLKPNRWLTMVFHNSKNSVWNAIQEAILKAGFVIADVRVLDKKQGSFKQVTTTSAVKKDLIVSAYKPREGFIKEFCRKGGSEEGVWEFVSQHLEKLPVVVEKDEYFNVVAERQNHLLYDRMVAFHIQNGYSIPIGAAEFFKGLENKFSVEDGMYFLDFQCKEYIKKRLKVNSVRQQLSIYVKDEKTTIQWLRYQLNKKPQTYQEIMPNFMQEANFFPHEKGLELQEILEQNFLKDDKGRWYVPDPNRQADLEKLRERALLQEFEEYKGSRGKLKKFRAEAVRAGFKHCWSNGDYKTIIEIAKRIPDNVLQEDSSLLMYYNNSLTREGQK